MVSSRAIRIEVTISLDSQDPGSCVFIGESGMCRLAAPRVANLISKIRHDRATLAGHVS